MRIKILSLVVILGTIICVTIMLFGDNFLKPNMENDGKVQVFKHIYKSDMNFCEKQDIDYSEKTKQLEKLVLNLSSESESKLGKGKIEKPKQYAGEDINKIRRVMVKLSAVDENRAEELLKNDEVKAALAVIKSRLIVKDYESIKYMIDGS